MARAAVLERTSTAEEAPVYGPFPDETCKEPVCAVVQGVALCAKCHLVSLHKSGRATIGIVGPFPWNNPSFESGYHCGDPIPVPKWTQPSANPPGYRAAGKMTRFLPGKAGYVGLRDAELRMGRRMSAEESEEFVKMAKRQNGALGRNRIQAQMATTRSADDSLPIMTALDDRFECGECGLADDDRSIVAEHIYATHAAYQRTKPISQAPVAAESAPVADDGEKDPEPSTAAPGGFRFGGFINNPDNPPAAPKVTITLSGRAVMPVSVEAPPRPEPRPQPRPRPAAIDGLSIINSCDKCGGTGRIRKKRWAKRWNGQGDGYRLAKCQACKALPDGQTVAQNRTERPSQAPVAAERPVRTLEQVMDVTPSERRRTRAILPDAVVKTVDEAESFMWGFLGAEVPKPAGQVERDRIAELEQMVRQRNEAIEIARREIRRLQDRIDELSKRQPLTADNDARIGQVAQLREEVDQLKVNRDRWIADYEVMKRECEDALNRVQLAASRVMAADAETDRFREAYLRAAAENVQLDKALRILREGSQDADVIEGQFVTKNGVSAHA